MGKLRGHAGLEGSYPWNVEAMQLAFTYFFAVAKLRVWAESGIGAGHGWPST